MGAVVNGLEGLDGLDGLMIGCCLTCSLRNDERLWMVSTDSLASGRAAMGTASKEALLAGG